MAMLGSSPDLVVGCAGGGSNFAGLSFPFLCDKKVILMNWSGHGLMDLTGYQAYFDGTLRDHSLPEEQLARYAATLEGLPKPPPL